MKLPPIGSEVTAKRAGWDEVLTPEQQWDMDPYEHQGDDESTGKRLTKRLSNW